MTRDPPLQCLAVQARRQAAQLGAPQLPRIQPSSRRLVLRTLGRMENPWKTHGKPCVCLFIYLVIYMFIYLVLIYLLHMFVYCDGNMENVHETFKHPQLGLLKLGLRCSRAHPRHQSLSTEVQTERLKKCSRPRLAKSWVTE